MISSLRVRLETIKATLDFLSAIYTDAIGVRNKRRSGVDFPCGGGFLNVLGCQVKIVLQINDDKNTRSKVVDDRDEHRIRMGCLNGDFPLR